MVRPVDAHSMADPTTADRIRAVAARLFSEKGFSATSVREIVGEVGLSPGAIYNHFESKEALLYAIALETHERLLDALNRTLADRSPTAGEDLDRLVTVVALNALEVSRSTRTSEREYMHLSEPHRMRIAEIRRQILLTFESTLLAGVESGEFSLPEGSPRAARRLATSIVNLLIRLSDGTAADPSTSEYQLSNAETVELHVELVRRMTRAIDNSSSSVLAVPDGIVAG